MENGSLSIFATMVVALRTVVSHPSKSMSCMLLQSASPPSSIAAALLLLLAVKQQPFNVNGPLCVLIGHSVWSATLVLALALMLDRSDARDWIGVYNACVTAADSTTLIRCVQTLHLLCQRTSFFHPFLLLWAWLSVRAYTRLKSTTNLESMVSVWFRASSQLLVHQKSLWRDARSLALIKN